MEHPYYPAQAECDRSADDDQAPPTSVAEAFEAAVAYVHTLRGQAFVDGLASLELLVVSSACQEVDEAQRSVDAARARRDTAIVAAYEAGHSLRQIGEVARISHAYVAKVLERHGRSDANTRASLAEPAPAHVRGVADVIPQVRHSVREVGL